MIAAAGLLVGVFAGGPAGGATVEVRCELVANGPVIGVRFIVPRGKHVYWTNPGDAGLPTSVEFRLPEGFRAGPLRWAVPEKFVQPGDVTGFGYRRELLVWTRIVGPEGGPPAGSKVRASVSWLECDDRECVSGRAELEAAWPLNQMPDAFDRWASRMPEAGGGAKPAGAPGRWEISIPWTDRSGGVRWVAACDPRAVVTDVVVRAGDPVRIGCTIAPAPGSRLPAGGVEVVVGYKPFWREMKGIAVEIPAGDIR